MGKPSYTWAMPATVTGWCTSVAWLLLTKFSPITSASAKKKRRIFIRQPGCRFLRGANSNLSRLLPIHLPLP